MPPKTIAKEAPRVPAQYTDLKYAPFDLCAEIKHARIANALTPDQLAVFAGCSATDIHDIEAGLGRVEHLARVMDTLKIDLAGIKPGTMLHHRLTATREAKKWSVEKLAARAGLSPECVANLETGRGDVKDLLIVLKVLAPGYRRRASPLAKDAQDKDCRFTPSAIVQAIHSAFGKVDLDPCAHSLSPMQADNQIRKEIGGDGLNEEWEGHFVFVNPPYSSASQWLAKVNAEWGKGKIEILLCLSNAKTDAAALHDALRRGAWVFLFKGRIKYLKPDGTSEPSSQASMMIAYGTSRSQREGFAELVAGSWLVFPP
jgi:transcriptional regulator with XRE-family HTH domain